MMEKLKTMRVQIQSVWIKINTARPFDGAMINAGSAEISWVFEALKYWKINKWRNVARSATPIDKLQLQYQIRQSGNAANTSVHLFFAPA